MSVYRYNPILTDYGNGGELEHWYHPQGVWVYYEDHIKILDQHIAEVTSLKAELASLMSSLESWDEEFK